MPDKQLRETETTRVLRMIWSTEANATIQWNLPNPKSGIAKSEVDGFMSEAIDDQFLLKDNHEINDIKDAYIYETNKIELA